ncbi:MAG: hypothetical protein IK125_06195 [Lachnospiraceae bacterium]|nr:hypothetical protein [Lachnospiraceae bacterium]
MKCYSCGGEVSLTDEKCPYCGRSLKETAGHREDKKQYEQRSEKAKGKLAKAISGHIPIVISAAVMILLIIGICVAAYIKDNAYHFRSDAARRESVKKYDEYTVKINEYLNAGDYTGFAAFKEYHNIAEYEEPYDDLNLLWDVVQDYTRLVSNVEDAMMYGPEARRYSPETDIFNCRSAIDNFYHDFEYHRSEIEKDKYSEYMLDMKKKADLILKIYLGIGEDKLDDFLAGSINEKEAYLEEVILHD